MMWSRGLGQAPAALAGHHLADGVGGGRGDAGEGTRRCATDRRGSPRSPRRARPGPGVGLPGRSRRPAPPAALARRRRGRRPRVRAPGRLLGRPPSWTACRALPPIALCRRLGRCGVADEAPAGLSGQPVTVGVIVGVHPHGQPGVLPGGGTKEVRARPGWWPLFEGGHGADDVNLEPLSVFGVAVTFLVGGLEGLRRASPPWPLALGWAHDGQPEFARPSRRAF
jgi:hypothetical protein